MKHLIDFLKNNFPEFNDILLGSPIIIIWAFGFLYLAGYLKVKYKLRTGITRKIYHFIIFTSAFIVQLIWDVSIVLLFGAVSSLAILYAIIKGNGNILYEAIAREKDAPYRTHFIIVPYLATVIGALMNNILFNELALVSYLVAGLGDAIGEPVGVMFGKHKYKVPSFKRIKTFRSLEGSLAVFIVSFLCILFSHSLIFNYNLSFQNVLCYLFISLVCTIIEAFSPHGWDNFTMQITPAILLYYFM